MKRAVVAIAVAVSCSCHGEAAAPRTLVVFAAASLRDAFTEIGARFETAESGTKVIFQFAGSPALVEQLREGASADVFASADEANMKKLDDAGALDGEAETFAKNRLAIAVRRGNPNKIASLADLSKPTILCGLCAPEVPAGAYARNTLKGAGVEVAPRTLEQNVRALVQKVVSGDLDAAIVYITDIRAFPDKLDAVDIPDAVNAAASYPLAIVKSAKNRQCARRFVDFVRSDAGAATLRKHGFLAP
ncbi:MAG: molybdate ABC transporter substrate-binding protein [Planctomycetes bacterium]|nr:molybdate ABC transporter substrate-binding protein [Planctomycetota bacterium]